MSFAAMIDTLFADPVLGRDATYWPAGGGVLTVRVMRRRDESPAPILETRMKRPAQLFDVRVSDVAQWAKGDILQPVGEAQSFIVRDAQADREGLVWQLDTDPV